MTHNQKQLHKLAKSDKLNSQRGAAMIVGIVIVTMLVLGALVVGYLALTNKPSTGLQAVPVEVSADDLLTEGITNGELVIDGRIIKAGLDRDEEQRSRAEAALNDEALNVGNAASSSTVVQEESLSSLQAQFIAEADRRLEVLDKAATQAQKLEPAQKPTVLKIIDDEETALTGLKAKAAAQTTMEALEADITALEAEYVNYGLAAAQTYLLLWANSQIVLDEKVNVFGGKLQERLNAASDAGTSIAQAQTLLNSYQTNKTRAKEATAEALKSTLAVKAGSYEANRAVLKTYYTKLANAHTEVKTALDTGQDVVKLIASFSE